MIRKLTLFLVLAVCAVGAQAAVIYHADLTPEAVVPGSEAPAFGESTLIISDDGTQISLTLNFAGLDSPQTAAHLLFAATAEVGTMAMELPNGTPMATTFANTVDLETALGGDTLAIQVYSELWPEGAIRGNFEFVAVESEHSSWSHVKNLFQ